MKWLSSVSGTIVTLESIISLYMRLLLVNARVKLVSGAAIDRFRIKKKYVLKEKAMKQYYTSIRNIDIRLHSIDNLHIRWLMLSLIYVSYTRRML